MQSFITCHLAYCNSLFSGIIDSLLSLSASSWCRTQQRDSSPALTTRRRDHITPVLRQLHWLPVRQRVDFKLPLPGLQVAARFNCSISCRRLPACLSRQPSPAIRSADIDTCCVPRTNTRLGDRPELCSRWTAALEQSAGHDSPARQRHWIISSAAAILVFKS